MPARSASSKNGFTLIELMVTIAIIAILATVGMVIYSSLQKSARVSKRIQDLDALKLAVEAYKTTNNFYPKANSASGFCIGSTSANSLLAATPAFSPYMQSIPKDPSSVDNATSPCYMYKSDAAGNEYKIWTSGIPTSEMDTDSASNAYATQPNYLDPARDSGSAACTKDPPASGTTYTAWAVWSSMGNSCGY